MADDPFLRLGGAKLGIWQMKSKGRAHAKGGVTVRPESIMDSLRLRIPHGFCANTARTTMEDWTLMATAAGVATTASNTLNNYHGITGARSAAAPGLVPNYRLERWRRLRRAPAPLQKRAGCQDPNRFHYDAPGPRDTRRVTTPVCNNVAIAQHHRSPPPP